MMRPLKTVLSEHRIVHLCIDNQMIFPLLYETDSTVLQQWFEFGRTLAAVTNELADSGLPTINVQFDLEEGDKQLLQDNLQQLPFTIDHVFYDADHFRIYRKEGASTANLPVFQSDLCNKWACEQFVFIKSHEDAFYPDKGSSRLLRFLKEKGFDTILISGFYADAPDNCVYQTVRSALDAGLGIYILADQTRFRSGQTLADTQAVIPDLYQDKRVTRLTSSDLIAILAK